jgi:alpha/beta superfamily hydrolase
MNDTVMIKFGIHLLIIILIVFFLSHTTYGQMKTENFTFIFEGKKRSGLIHFPLDKQPESMIIIVPGDGQTNIEIGMYRDISSRFVQMGLACCLWDKSGCGKSEGKYDDQQTVQNSAKEFITAIKELKQLKIAGIKYIGLWGISRGGWIAPLIMEEEKSIAFWISVSGVDDKDNNIYLFEKNLLIQGRSDDSVKTLISEYRAGNRIFWQGGSYEEYVKATKNLYKDSFYIKLHSELDSSEEEYVKNQTEAMKKYKFDDTTASIILVPGYSEILQKIQCPVLAIFGEKDSQVDWQKTIAFYKETIGVKTKSELVMKTFPNCGHVLYKCKTCGFDNEDLKLFNYQPCDGYYDTMSKWLREHGFLK